MGTLAASPHPPARPSRGPHRDLSPQPSTLNPAVILTVCLTQRASSRSASSRWPSARHACPWERKSAERRILSLSGLTPPSSPPSSPDKSLRNANDRSDLRAGWGQVKSRQDKFRQLKSTKSGQAKPSQAKPSQAKPSSVKSGRAKPSPVRPAGEAKARGNKRRRVPERRAARTAGQHSSGSLQRASQGRGRKGGGALCRQEGVTATTLAEASGSGLHCSEGGRCEGGRCEGGRGCALVRTVLLVTERAAGAAQASARTIARLPPGRTLVSPRPQPPV